MDHVLEPEPVGRQSVLTTVWRRRKTETLGYLRISDGQVLLGKAAVVTAGSESIGLAAAAKRLAAAGATVFIAGRRQRALDKAVAEIGGVQAHISNPPDLDRVYEAVRSSKGRINILFAKCRRSGKGDTWVNHRTGVGRPDCGKFQGYNFHGSKGFAPTQRRCIN